MIALRPYQEEAIAAVEACDKQSQMVVLPTGTGKTVVFSEIVRRRTGDRGALILAHRDELLQQAADKLQTVAPELAMSVGFVQASRNDTHAPVVIGSVQTLARRARLEQLPREFAVVIVDEAHHAAADSYKRILAHVSPSPLILGFTATPERHDKKSKLDDVFDEIVYAKSIEEMIRSGYLCNLRALRLEVDELDLSEVRKSAGDFVAEDLGRAMDEADAVDDIVAGYMQHAEGRKTIAFLPTVALSKETAESFRAAGVAAGHVDGETPREERRETLRQLKRGELDIVCNVGVLTEGFDEPSIECVIVGAPTKSRVRYAQMVGRGTRIHPGKTDCLILDVAGVSEDLTIQSIGVLFGLRRLDAGEDIMAALDRQADEDAIAEGRKERKRAYDRARRKARTAELFNRDRIHWVELRGRWVVSLKKQMLVLDEADPDAAAGWRVLTVGESGANIVVDNLDFGYAQGVVEQLVRDAGAEVLADREAPWRLLDASPKQLNMLRRLGVHVADPDLLSKGDAGDLITKTLAEQRLARLDRALGREEEPTHA